MNISVKRLYCTGCGSCVTACPVQIISLKNGHPIIEQEGCTDCQECRSECPAVAEKSRGFRFVHLERCQNCVGKCLYNRVQCIKRKHAGS